MNRIIIVVFLTALFGLSTTLNAQNTTDAITYPKVNAGINAGYNLHGIFAKDIHTTPAASTERAGNPENFRMLSGFSAGPVLEINFNKKWALQPALEFTMLGFRDKYNSGGTVVRKFSLFYLQLPILAQYRWSINDAKILVQAGPYVGYGLFGRQAYSKKGKAKELDDTYKKLTFGRSNAEDFYLPYDLGAQVGVGFEYGRFQVTLSEEMSLTKTTFAKPRAYSANYHLAMQNHAFTVAVAVIFGKKVQKSHQDFY